MQPVIVIGAGIAGLAAAWELRQRGLPVLVLEKTDRAGGVIRTEHVDGFVIDAGPDSFLIQKPAAITLCRELGIEQRLVSTLLPRTAYVIRRGRLTPLPDASFLGLPTRLGPFVTSPLFSWTGKLRMLAEAMIGAKADHTDESIGSFMRRRFGQEAVDYLAEPLLAGIHAGDVEQLSIGALFPRLPEMERTRGSVLRALVTTRAPRSPHGAFMSLPGGTGELIQALVSRLGDDVIRYNAPVEEVSGSRPYRVRVAPGDTLTASSVIITVPAWAAAPMLRPLDAVLSALCGHILYASSATIAFGFARDQIGHPMKGTGFVVPRRERRMLMAGTWVSSKWPHRVPEGCALIRGFVGGTSDPDVLARTDEELSRAVYEELAALLNISGPPRLTRVYRWPQATPQYEVGHLARVKEIDARLDTLPGLYLTGSGYRGTGIPDCIADARAAAASAAARLR
jgi:oxygen-dependent protoporphyrinogen oxidase